MGTRYLVVECKDKGYVSAGDVMRFVRKVGAFYDYLRRSQLISLAPPPIKAVLAYTEGVNEDARIAARRFQPTIEFLPLG